MVLLTCKSNSDVAHKPTNVTGCSLSYIHNRNIRVSFSKEYLSLTEMQTQEAEFDPTNVN